MSAREIKVRMSLRKYNTHKSPRPYAPTGAKRNDDDDDDKSPRIKPRKCNGKMLVELLLHPYSHDLQLYFNLFTDLRSNLGCIPVYHSTLHWVAYVRYVHCSTSVKSHNWRNPTDVQEFPIKKN